MSEQKTKKILFILTLAMVLIMTWSSCPLLYRSDNSWWALSIILGSSKPGLFLNHAGLHPLGSLSSCIAEIFSYSKTTAKRYSRFDFWFLPTKTQETTRHLLFLKWKHTPSNSLQSLDFTRKVSSVRSYSKCFSKETIHTMNQFMNDYAASVMKAWYFQKQGPRSAGTSSSVSRA